MKADDISKKVVPIQFYDSWRQMKQRCMNEKNKRYEYYGRRGIKVCARWYKFVNFYEDMWEHWESGLTIDRINNEGNYEPDNCRWATRQQQVLNRRKMKSNKTGLVGVRSRGGRYLASAGNAYLGSFRSSEEAAYVRDQAVLQIWGNEARINFEY